MQLKPAEQAVKDLLINMGINFNKHNDIENTPKRVVKMLAEVWEGEKYSNKEIADMFGKTFPTNSTAMVVVKDIECFSYCEHHLALMYNMKISVGYLPRGKVIGLSKIARIADMCCKRLQLQEKITSDINETMRYVVGNDVVVYVEAEHSCVTARGIKKAQAKTVTLETYGRFRNNEFLKQFLQQIGK